MEKVKYTLLIFFIFHPKHTNSNFFFFGTKCLGEPTNNSKNNNFFSIERKHNLNIKINGTIIYL